MANEKQYRYRTVFVATRGVKEYRASINQYINRHDIVLEIGCEWGTTSELIYPKCKQLIATDISSECILRAKQMRSEIHFETLDVYDLKSALSFGLGFTKMYIDVSGLSGYRSLLDVIALLNTSAAAFPIQAIVVKSGALKDFAKKCVAWDG
ncbi:class I SAM-dependent methyltransferase [Candidatus Dojkabacteria bacterium]|uniref:Class I SAM-dependent methyltransferase n=1 Tax=Candidatus Dojkabacteria bacterium TaxID=2099670 RepID=A0A955HZ19_9BACT|nr:class I SAM-dependent methyltransferase [Candidatus Dojkabacteria bacterium]MCB9790559.1 class I SAM-dependent methyltransferase [Candidatus Nomurabacteria bacterium]